MGLIRVAPPLDIEILHKETVDFLALTQFDMEPSLRAQDLNAFNATNRTICEACAICYFRFPVFVLKIGRRKACNMILELISFVNEVKYCSFYRYRM